MRTKEAMEAEFIELVKQLDDVEVQAFIVWAETARALLHIGKEVSA